MEREIERLFMEVEKLKSDRADNNQLSKGQMWDTAKLIFGGFIAFTTALAFFGYQSFNSITDTIDTRFDNDFIAGRLVANRQFRAEIAKVATPLPPDALVAFVSGECPDGWEDYELGYGRFLRGMDPTNDIDPTPDRAAGSLQEDSIGEHQHQLQLNHSPTSTRHRAGGGSNNQNVVRHEASQTANTSGGPSGETRPKNVAVRFCNPKIESTP